MHIKEITKKNFKNTGALFKLRQYLPSNTLLSVYRSIIECHINYCNLIFGNASFTYLSPLIIAQKKAVRIVANEPTRSHSDPIFSALNLLKVTDFYRFNLGVYMRKNEGNFRQNYRINVHNTRSGNHYVPSFQRISSTLNKSIMYQAPHNWGHIPSTVKNSPSLRTFKKSYRAFLISYYQREVL